MILKIFLILLIFSPQCFSSDLFLQINGVSKHFEEKQKFNERNYGVGLEYDGLSAGTFKNSLSTQSYYLGYSLKHKGKSEFMLSPGLFVGGLYYKSKRGNLFPVALPLLSIGRKDSYLNFIYLPKINKTAAALFINYNVKLF